MRAMAMVKKMPRPRPHPAKVNGRESPPPPMIVERRVNMDDFTVPSAKGLLGSRVSFHVGDTDWCAPGGSLLYKSADAEERSKSALDPAPDSLMYEFAAAEP